MLGCPGRRELPFLGWSRRERCVAGRVAAAASTGRVRAFEPFALQHLGEALG